LLLAVGIHRIEKNGGHNAFICIIRHYFDSYWFELGVSMRKAILLSALILAGCNNNAENKKNFEACVQQAEQKFKIANASICIHQAWHKPGECSYNIESNNAYVRSKDNEITACALMYAPK
jgi:hypothetical protein